MPRVILCALLFACLLPSAASAASISGTAAVGTTLWASPGNWDAPAFYFQWRRCSDGCVDISGATASTYEVGLDDMGSSLRVRVSDGTDTVETDATNVVPVLDPPVNEVAPHIEGVLEPEELIGPMDSEWSGSVDNVVHMFQWLRCDAAGDNCAEIGEESDWSGYYVTSLDPGHTLRVRETVTNPVGSDSVVTPPVYVEAVRSVTRPEVSGVAVEGSTLSASNGTWDGRGETVSSSFQYQWRRCDWNGDSCSNVTGANSASFVLGTADVGGTLRVAVTATSPLGSSTSVSEESPPIVYAEAPSLSEVPSISGDTLTGSTLSVSTGYWGAATGPLTFGYHWMRCSDADGEYCDWIDGAESSSYQLTAADLGSVMAVQVYATGLAGNSNTWVGPTDFVTAGP